MKKMHHKFTHEDEDDWQIPYIDFLSAAFALFVFIAIMVFAAISPKTENQNINKAEYTITVAWNNDLDCDVDTWLTTSTGAVVSFRPPKTADFISLERDDRGITSDTITTGDGSIIINPENKEYMVFRKIIPGEFYLNIHLYSCQSNHLPIPVGDKLPFDLVAHVTITKLNPTINDVYTVDYHFTAIWEETTIAHFSLNSDGDFIFLDKNLYQFVKAKS